MNKTFDWRKRSGHGFQACARHLELMASIADTIGDGERGEFAMRAHDTLHLAEATLVSERTGEITDAGMIKMQKLYPFYDRCTFEK